MQALTPLASWALLAALASLAVILVWQLCHPYLGDFPDEDTESLEAHVHLLRALSKARGAGPSCPAPRAPIEPYDYETEGD